MQSADLSDLYAEGLQPEEQALQGRLVRELAVYNRPDRFRRGDESVIVEQGFGREDPAYPDFVVRRWHCGPLTTRYHMARLTALRVATRRAPLTTGEFQPAEPAMSPVADGVPRAAH